MNLKNDYVDLLIKLKQTVSLKTFNISRKKNLIALRHDVDHSIYDALNMAYYEKKLNIKSTYFLLPSASYFDFSENFINQTKQLIDFGHEIGIHLDAYSDIYNGKYDSVDDYLKKYINFFNTNNISINGVSSHGNQLCYDHGFINHWCFEELKPKNPYSELVNLNAEGVTTFSDKKISYTKDHIIFNNLKLNFWSTKLKSFGIDYVASNLRYDKYFSDSNKRWYENQNPFIEDTSRNRLQILIHPEHWRDDKKLYFFLSAPRSGSKWFSNLLKDTTGIKTRHEFLFNQNFYNKKTYKKETTTMSNISSSGSLRYKYYSNFYEEFTNSNLSVAEVNVYLSSYVEELKKYFPYAKFFYIKRNKNLIFSSMKKRGWFKNNNNQDSQLNMYLDKTEKILNKYSDDIIELEKTKDQSYLIKFFNRHSIPFYSYINSVRNKEKVDSSNFRDIELKTAFYYDKLLKHISFLSFRFLFFSLKKTLLPKLDSKLFYQKGCKVILDKDLYKINFTNESNNAYFSFFGTSWGNQCLNFHDNAVKIPSQKNVCLNIKSISKDNFYVGIYLKFFDKKGDNISLIKISDIDAFYPKNNLSFHFHPKAKFFDIFLYFPHSIRPKQLSLKLNLKYG